MDATFPNKPEPVIEAPAYQIMPDRLSVLETELRRLRDRQKWYVILWSVLFALLLVETVTFVYLHETDLGNLRTTSGTQNDQLTRRVDDARTHSDDQIVKQTQPLGDRLNQLDDQITILRIETGILQSRLDNLSMPTTPVDK